MSKLIKTHRLCATHFHHCLNYAMKANRLIHNWPTQTGSPHSVLSHSLQSIEVPDQTCTQFHQHPGHPRVLHVQRGQLGVHKSNSNSNTQQASKYQCTQRHSLRHNSQLSTNLHTDIFKKHTYKDQLHCGLVSINLSISNLHTIPFAMRVKQLSASLFSEVE